MRTTFLTLAAAALTLTACSNDDEIVNDGQVSARFIAQINDVAQARAAGVAWDIGDAIGISASGNEGMSRYKNVKYTTADGKGNNFTGSPIYFQNNDDVTFTAYYPFAGDEGTAAGEITNNTKSTNQTPDNKKTIDYLFAETTGVNVSNPNVAFSFNHCMSQITLTFKNGDDTDVSLISAYTIKGLKMEGSFNPATGTATATSDAAEDLTIAVSGLSEESSAVAPVILYPQAASDVKLSVTLAGQEYKCDLAINGSKLEAGNNYAFDITVSKTGLNVTGCTINDWIPVLGTILATQQSVNHKVKSLLLFSTGKLQAKFKYSA